ncbi:MAG: GNAT family N-acetyltransferase [Levilactobacillus sp.]|jgi:ElaA protein|uniref:GNAT family N-acetyltransferase n=1 Tax=Levilactobacillus sp. TaxID=2767919 RepID=UPI0025826B02|nr:GNAT family N-acetyltransferase [Levilactobacillus sp.]MCI1553235.1 GNAT family N-acetyltransferase [Levilactobacillus sp.]MCI1599432.1 GNAT family N-acetyltransferase [Levilactobacillus sp.]MCI1606969.1 GNAT family N-acetyltransferase [Levilactobacillus sp.]
MNEFIQKTFSELTPLELFEIYRLRVAVFVVEQDCAYQEVDDADQVAQHLFLPDAAGHVLVYARLIPEPRQVRIGRVVVAPSARRHGAGRELVTTAIQAARTTYPQAQRIVIQAQAYLQKFYASFGFQPVSDVYLDTGIPHLDMVLPLAD